MPVTYCEYTVLGSFGACAVRAVCRATVRLCVGGVLCDPLSHYVTLFQIGSGAPVRAALWGLVGPVSRLQMISLSKLE